MAEQALALQEYPQIIELLAVKYRPWWSISALWKKNSLK